LYGTIAPAGLADRGRMRSVFEWNGLTARQIGISFDSVVAALKRKHPVLIGNGLTQDGHILVAIGYTSNGDLIVNDPYGNRFASGYGANDGEGLFYLYSCMRVKNALEVIGTYPPPTSTPTATHPPAPAPASNVSLAKGGNNSPAQNAQSTPGVYTASLLPGAPDSQYAGNIKDDSRQPDQEDSQLSAPADDPPAATDAQIAPMKRQDTPLKWLVLPVLVALLIMLWWVVQQKMPAMLPIRIPVRTEEIADEAEQEP